MDLFAIGEIVKTRGLRGCLKVFSYTETQKNFAALQFIYIENHAGQKNHHNISKIEVSGKFLFIELEGIEDVGSAGRFVGCTIFVPKELFQNLAEDEYYWQDIIGLNVFSEEGKHLGRIESIFPTGSNDVYVCKGGPREILLPAIADVIRQIDIPRGIMTVKVPKGL
jgi:16S rRNA processing protein RimM